jgi:deazaflavin-dependent oxidoreductase (nitroreductase family)
VEVGPRPRGDAGGYRRHIASRNEQIIDEFRANEGRVGGRRTLLLLHHTGAKTGTEYVNPLAYKRLSDDSVAIFASKGGSPRTPGWFYNLVAHPDVTVEIGTERYSAHARVAEGTERETIWEKQKADSPVFAEYEKKTEGIREIPVVVLELAA